MFRVFPILYWIILIIIESKRSCRKVMFSQASVFPHRLLGRQPVGSHLHRHTPPGRHPPARHRLGRHHSTQPLKWLLKHMVRKAAANYSFSTLNWNTVNPKFQFCNIFVRFLSFHVYNGRLIRTRLM